MGGGSCDAGEVEQSGPLPQAHAILLAYQMDAVEHAMGVAVEMSLEASLVARQKA